MAEAFHRSFFLNGPAGRLEAMLWTVPKAEAEPRRVAVVCHPHPLFGGTMHNKVVFQLAKEFASRGRAGAALQFSRRGTERGQA